MPKQVTIMQAAKAIRDLPGARIENVREGLDFYGRRILEKHFQQNNDKKYNYPKLDPKYARYKKSKVGAKPQLVFSGALKRKALKRVRAKIQGKEVVLKLSVPNYGQFQILKGRNWLNPSKRDLKQILRYMKKKLKSERKKDPNVRVSV